MFKSQLIIYGKHAEILKKYSPDKQAEEQFPFYVESIDSKQQNIEINMFETMIQTFMVAGMIGIIDKKTSEEDTNSNIKATIFAEALTNNMPQIKRMIQFMNLTTEDLDFDARIKKAFTVNENEGDEKKLLGYVRYGLEKIDNYFNKCNSVEEVASAWRDLLNDYKVK